jgi:hypothetical protein
MKLKLHQRIGLGILALGVLLALGGLAAHGQLASVLLAAAIAAIVIGFWVLFPILMFWT